MKYTEKQLKDLKKIIIYLKENNIYYSKILQNIDLTNYENLLLSYNKIYPTSRDDILNNYETCLDQNFLKLFKNNKEALDVIFDLSDVSENYDKKIDVADNHYLVENTSGSSGRPFPIVKSEQEKIAEAMQLLSMRKKVYKGTKIDNGFLLVHKIDDFLKNINLKDSIEELDLVIDYMIEKRPLWIFSSTYVFGRILQRIKQTNKEKEMQKLCIKFIETTSQQLLEEEKEDLKKIFKTVSVSNYGCREVWNIAYGVKGDDKLYVNDKTLFVEILDEYGDRITQEGIVGNIVVTSLTHKTLPFVRYFVGDSAAFYYDKDGKTYLKLSKGRKFEKIYGTNFYGPFVFRNVLRTLNFKENIQDIKNIRIIQDEINHLKVYVNKMRTHDKSFENKFTKIFNDCIQHSLRFELEFIYKYPFEKQKSLYKQKIFECHINGKGECR